MKYPNWKVPERGPVIPRSLTDAGCTPLLAAMLHLRGLDDADKARTFLRGGRELLTDPFALIDMDAAVRRLKAAAAEKEHVAVYGDYDVDGITSACLLADYLESLGLECEVYIPDRRAEGYGVNADAIDRLREKGVTLIVTVDCGVTCVEEAEYARTIGIDMIVTDHHECRGDLPRAVAVVDPKRPGGGGAGEDLAGVGVAFKLVCAMDGNVAKMLDRYGDLVAVGTVADVMPLLGENRTVTRCGLRKISQGDCRPGFTALLRVSGAVGKPVTASTVSYSLAPLINAAGRLDSAEKALELLRADDYDEAERMACELREMNLQRKNLGDDIMASVETMIGAERPHTPIVLAAEGWHPGVIGIVASKLTDEYGVPAVMISLSGETGKGSCRSVGDFNLYEALSACSDCLIGFGGHAMAVGITVRADRVDDLRRELAEYYLTHPADSAPALEAEILVSGPELLEEKSVEDMEALEPCGNGNPRPLLYLEDARISSMTPIGRDRKHLRLSLDSFGRTWDSVFFQATAGEIGAGVGDRVDAVFAPQINTYRASRSVQLVITDLRPHRETTE